MIGPRDFEQIFLPTSDGGVLVMDRNQRGGWTFHATRSVTILTGMVMGLLDDGEAVKLELNISWGGDRITMGSGDTLTVAFT